MTIVAFDFDGTITKCDTFLAFLLHSKGKTRVLCGFIRFLPYLILYKLGLYSNSKLKENVFSYFYSGMILTEFDNLCNSFFDSHKDILYNDACDEINNHIKENKEVIIVTASIENWVKPYANYLNVKKLIGTQIEVMDNRITGKFLSPNCYGIEKVNRLLHEYKSRNKYELIVYGDSKGDYDLIKIADVGYLRKFKK